MGLNMGFNIIMDDEGFKIIKNKVKKVDIIDIEVDVKLLENKLKKQIKNFEIENEKLIREVQSYKEKGLNRQIEKKYNEYIRNEKWLLKKEDMLYRLQDFWLGIEEFHMQEKLWNNFNGLIDGINNVTNTSLSQNSENFDELEKKFMGIGLKVDKILGLFKNNIEESNGTSYEEFLALTDNKEKEATENELEKVRQDRIKRESRTDD